MQNNDNQYHEYQSPSDLDVSDIVTQALRAEEENHACQRLAHSFRGEPREGRDGDPRGQFTTTGNAAFSGSEPSDDERRSAVRRDAPSGQSRFFAAAESLSDDDDQSAIAEDDVATNVGRADGGGGAIPEGNAGGYRVQGKHFILTYPQTDHGEGRQAVLSLLRRLGPKRYLVGRENHQDGSPHIHVYVEFHQKLNIRDQRFFDIECGCKHPNIQSCRSFRASIQYVSKDGQFDHLGFSEQELQDIRKPRRSRNRPASNRTAIGCRLLSGERIETVARDFPEILVGSSILQFQLNADMVRAFQPELVNRVLTQISIFNYIYTFDPTKPVRGEGGNHHLWLYGQPGCGKSTIFTSVMDQWRIYFVSDGANWAGFDSDLYDCIVFDECTPETLKKTTFSVLNTIMDGRPCNLNSKGGSGGAGHQKFNKKMPIIFISNWDVMQMEFPNNPSFGAFMSRLKLIEITRNRPPIPFYSMALEVPNPHMC